MNKKPAHLSGTAGQIVNSLEIGDTEEMFLSKRAVHTLGDYIKNAQSAEQRLDEGRRKLTFDEWYFKEYQITPTQARQRGVWDVGDMEICWKAAQENM